MALGNLGGLSGLLKIGGLVGSLLPNKSKKANQFLEGLGMLGAAVDGFKSKNPAEVKTEQTKRNLNNIKPKNIKPKDSAALGSKAKQTSKPKDLFESYVKMNINT